MSLQIRFFFFMLILTSGVSAQSLTCLDLDGAYVFGQDPESTYLGFFGSEAASDSIMNEVGQFGSEVRINSVRNPVGEFGSEVRQYSANNPVTSTPPVIGKNGDFVAFLTTNPVIAPGVSLDAIDEACTGQFIAFSPRTGPQGLVPPELPQGGGGDGGGPGPLVDFGLAGLWWNPERAGEGVNLDFGGGAEGVPPFLLFTWYTYFADSTAPMFLTGAIEAPSGADQLTFDVFYSFGPTFGPDYDPADLQTDQLGQVTLTFESCDRIILSFTSPFSNFPAVEYALQRVLPRQPGHTCLQ